MIRNMMKTVETIKGKGLIPDRYDITISEINTLHAMVHTGLDGELDALTTAFDYGFILGSRAQKAGKLQSKKASAMSEDKKTYLDMIVRAVHECNDISTLDLAWKIIATSESTTK